MSGEATARSLLPTGWQLKSIKKGQTLWASFGNIYHVECLDDQGQTHSLILKLVSPPPGTESSGNEGNLRKLYSYEVEQYFYGRLTEYMAQSAPSPIAAASCLGSTLETRAAGNADVPIALLIEDLRKRFPKTPSKRGLLDKNQTYAALTWLARFHGFWWERVRNCDHLLQAEDRVKPPLEEVNFREKGRRERNVWANGGYTYLATRRSEYKSLEVDSSYFFLTRKVDRSSPTSLSIAEAVAKAISYETSPQLAPFMTLIHGDVKSENLFTTADGSEAAFFDFQYVGIGLGTCDLAKLLTCSVSEAMLGFKGGETAIPMCAGEKSLLQDYLDQLQKAAGPSLEYNWDRFLWHWELALVDWYRFQASWGFWGAEEWLSARVRHIVDQPGWVDRLTTAID